MKVYISGKTTGISFDESRCKFSQAELLLTELGLNAVNPIHSIDETSFENRIVRQIELMIGCDGVFMLDGWRDSVEAGIEYDIAIRTGKIILFESTIEYENKLVSKISSVVHEVTGVSPDEFTKKGKSVECVMARMLFVYNCHRQYIKKSEISNLVLRDRTTIVYSLKKYEDEYMFNKKFRDMADRVDSLLKEYNH